MHSWFNKNFKKKRATVGLVLLPIVINSKITDLLKYHKSYLIVVWGIFGGLFSYVFYKLMVINPNGVYIGQPNSWSDWVVHISITNIFANKPINEWFLYHPFFAYGKLTYGFLVHFLTALLMRLGFRIDVAFFIISIILLFTFLTGLYFLYYQISNSRKKSILGIFIFFTSSGMGIFRYLSDLKLNDLLHPTQDYTKFLQYDWLAGNIPATMIIPQRAFFIGVTIGVWVLNLLLWGLEELEKNQNKDIKCTNLIVKNLKNISNLVNKISSKKTKDKLNQNWSYKLKLNKQQKLFLTAGVLAGVLPIAHMHSFIAIVIITGTICFFYILNMYFTPLILNKHSTLVSFLKYMPGFHIRSWFKKSRSLTKFSYKIKSIQKSKQLLFFIVPAGVISTVLYFTFIHGGIEVNNFMTVSLGWTATQDSTQIDSQISTTLLSKIINTKIIIWVKMWLQLWGTFLPTAVFSLFYLKKDKQNKQIKKHLSTFLGFITVFILANIVIFQPTAWDNTKLFAWVYLGLSILVSNLLVELWNKSKQFNEFKYLKRFKHLKILRDIINIKKISLKILTIILLFTLSFSGSIELVRIFNFEQNTHRLSSTQEIQLTKKIANNTKTNAVFLTSTKHNHPVPLWANRPIFLGYLGWVKNFGFDHTVRIQEVKNIFSGKKTANQIIIKNKISYIYVGPYEKNEFKINYNYLEQFSVAFRNESTIVYDTRELWE